MGTTTLIITGIIVLWVAHDLIWPYTTCKARDCRSGKRFSPTGINAWRACPACKGSGKKLRILARILRR
jgi:hypothetical protein